MSETDIILAGERLTPRPSGVLHWPARGLLVVGDLHLGRSERLARQGAGLLPPYETTDTLNRLDEEIARLRPRLVICLGDSFDDLEAAAALTGDVALRIERLAAGRRWIWVAGNHDPGPVDLPGTHLAEAALAPLVFRHIADPRAMLGPDRGEVSAHFHPKARVSLRGQRISRPCFLADERRVILPAFGTYTGGLDALNPAFDPLLAPTARALLLGRNLTPVSRMELA